MTSAEVFVAASVMGHTSSVTSKGQHILLLFHLLLIPALLLLLQFLILSALLLKLIFSLLDGLNLLLHLRSERH